jgi:hypothetical protein
MPSEETNNDTPIQEKVCRHCGNSFAPEEASPLDENLCGKCLKVSDLVMAPLIDEDGVTHKGRILKFTRCGDTTYVSPLKQIYEMTDEELEKFVVEYTQEVHLLETKTDYARIKLATAEFERGERKSHKARRRIKLLNAEGNVVDYRAVLRRKLSDSRRRTDATAALKAVGIDADKLAEILAKAGVKQK